MNKKVVITGGHFTPAVGVITELSKRGWKIYWFGDDRAIQGTDIKSLEARVLPELGIAFKKIGAAKFSKVPLFGFLLSSWKIVFGFVQSLVELLRIKPSVVLSFGSYLSVPVSFAAWSLGIPVVIHEQTAVSGMANRLVAKIAQKVAISFEGSRKYFPSGKTVLVGNVVRRGIFEIGRERKKKMGKIPLVYVTGGSRGAQPINKVVFAQMEDILRKAQVIHQTGELDLAQAENLSETLPPRLKVRYRFSSFYTPAEVEKIYRTADLVISRSGANTVSELAVVGLPAVLIPLPETDSDEQTKNAKLLEERNCAIIIPQQNLSGKSLLDALDKMFNHLDEYLERAKICRNLIPENAAQQLVNLLEKNEGD